MSKICTTNGNPDIKKTDYHVAAAPRNDGRLLAFCKNTLEVISQNERHPTIQCFEAYLFLDKKKQKSSLPIFLLKSTACSRS